MAETSKSFEASMERLETIVRQLEQGNAPLEESLKLFQEGTELVRACGKLLEDAKLQVSKITAGTDGEPVEEPFDEQL